MSNKTLELTPITRVFERSTGIQRNRNENWPNLEVVDDNVINRLHSCYNKTKTIGNRSVLQLPRVPCLHPPINDLRQRKVTRACTAPYCFVDDNTLPLAGGSAGLRWWRAGECANLQGGEIDCLNGRPGRVSLWLLAVGVANHFTLTSLTLDSPASGRVQSTNGQRFSYQ